MVIVGATGQTILGHFHLNQLWVESSLRNQGNGGRILECIVSQAIEQGCSEIRLDRHESQVEIIL
ncbi:MAG: GNAT family N-acetyltransferase [Candidatus Thiodiazotropha sp. 6PLUC9]